MFFIQLFFFFLHYTLFPLIQKCSSFVQLLSQGAFGYLLPIISFILAWMETWLLDFKVLPQEAGDEISENQISNFSETSFYKRYHWRLMDVDDIITHLLLQCVSIIMFSNHVCPLCVRVSFSAECARSRTSFIPRTCFRRPVLLSSWVHGR